MYYYAPMYFKRYVYDSVRNLFKLCLHYKVLLYKSNMFVYMVVIGNVFILWSYTSNEWELFGAI